MKSNLNKYYGMKDEVDILNTKGSILEPNPFYRVNRFITLSAKTLPDSLNLTGNLERNLEDLKILEGTNRECCSNYDPETNSIYSRNSKSDIFGLLHVASNDRRFKYSGIITRDGVGYGLNNGLTELFVNDISNKKFVYPIEAIIAKCLRLLNEEWVALSYFSNCGECLEDFYSDIYELMSLIDKYHDNYMELVVLYRERFAKERFYHNSVYGKALKEKNLELKELSDRIYNLEYTNFSTMYDIIDILVNIISDSENKVSTKLKILKTLNTDLNNIYNLEMFGYLNELTDAVKNNTTPNKLIKLK